MKTSNNNEKNGVHQDQAPALAHLGQNFGSEYDIPQLPPALEEKIQLAKRLNENIGRELRELTFGPGGVPTIPPGLPDEVIFQDEIEKIKDAIAGKHSA